MEICRIKCAIILKEINVPENPTTFDRQNIHDLAHKSRHIYYGARGATINI